MNRLDRINVEKEIKIHSRINHPHIVDLLDFFEEDSNAYLILEFVPGGNLFKYMGHHPKLKKDFIRQIFSDTVNAISYLHESGIILRDLKPENILLDSNNRVKGTFDLNNSFPYLL